MRRIVLLTCLLVGTALCLLAKTYIVAVGVSDYPGTQMDLRVSANDAKTIAKIFAKNGHSVAYCLRDSMATEAHVFQVMKEYFADAVEDDVIILFFSGHGFPGGLFLYDTHCFYEDIFEVMKQSKARNKVIFADACYSGKMRVEAKRDSTVTQNNVMFFLSSRSAEKSSETVYNNSLFTLYLERGLRGGADANRDRTITARELYNFVHEKVSEASVGLQHPVMWGKFDGGMPIIKW
ncbi:MAG: caspase family protein [Prevotella sp.]|nr:caspase family protein [Prevotella sp.]